MSPISLWLADYQLLAAALLLGVMLAIAALRQPAQRLAVAKSTLAALAALALLCALPGWSLVHLLSEPPTPIASIASTPIETPSLVQSNPLHTPPETLANVSPPSPSIEPSAAPQPAAALAEPISWSAYLVAAYAAGSGAVTLWLITGALLARRVRQQATPAPFELQVLLQQICGPEKSPPQLLFSPQITAPVALGIRRLTILLPPSALPLPPSQLLPILAHEWAHLEHRDLHTLAATRLLLVLLWPQPLYWLLRRTIRLDQETLADAAAADRAGRLDYAQQLLAWASSASTQRPPRLAGAVGLWEGPSQLKRRIAVLLNEQFNVMRSCSALWRRGTLAALTVLALGLSAVTLQPANSASEQASDKKAADSAQADAKPASGTTHQSVGMGTWKAVPIEPAKHQPNALELHIVDENEQPLAGVEALIYSVSLPQGEHVLDRTVATDADGKFVADNLVAPAEIERFKKLKADGGFIYDGSKGGYVIVLRRAGWATALIFQSPGDLALNGAKRTIKMRPAVKLSGQVTDPAGKPVAGAKVVAGDSFVGGFAVDGINAVTTDAEGRYEFADRAPFNRAESNKKQNQFLAASANFHPSPSAKDPAAAEDPSVNGVSNLLVSHPDYAVTRAEGGDVPGVADVQLLPAASIAGRVVQNESGAPAAGITVHAAGFPDATQGASNEMRIRSGHSAVTRTDATGAYRFSNLPAARYDVWADSGAQDMRDAPWVSRGQSRIEALPGGEPTKVPDLIIGPPAIVQVQLVDAESGEPVELPAGATANLASQRVDGPSMQPTPLQRVSTTTDGKFDMRLFPGRSRVLVFIHEGAVGTPAIWQTDDDVDSTGEVFNLQPGETISATIKVLPTARVNEFRERDMAANKLMEAKKYAEAIEAYSSLIADFPKSHFRVLQHRGHAYNRLGDYAAALADFEASLKLAPENAGTKFFIASLLATTPVDADRDSRRALEYTEQLATLARQRDDSQQWLASILDIQASAYADLGEFDKAIKIEQEAIELSHESQREAMKSRLELYHANKPFRRETPLSSKKKPSNQGASKASDLRAPFWTIPASTDLKLTITGVPAAEANRNANNVGATENETWRLLPEPALKVSNPTTLQEAVN